MKLDHAERQHMRLHEDDVRRLVAVAADYGVTVTPRQAYRAWISVSETSAASWLSLDSDDEILWGNAAGAMRAAAA